MAVGIGHRRGLNGVRDVVGVGVDHQFDGDAGDARFAVGRDAVVVAVEPHQVADLEAGVSHLEAGIEGVVVLARCP